MLSLLSRGLLKARAVPITTVSLIMLQLGAAALRDPASIWQKVELLVTYMTLARFYNPSGGEALGGNNTRTVDYMTKLLVADASARIFCN